ncbi:hypothetical protein NDU88_005591 [Pleurodeles waltl]|uniref:Histone H2A n=1 Tax=Pleurodeles waltl TaxID=8319 RepID=A0AAV7VJF0_PLEWA|nr:hypothetical protein NDU88_005591 [Pleurodeles waltl]
MFWVLVRGSNRSCHLGILQLCRVRRRFWGDGSNVKKKDEKTKEAVWQQGLRRVLAVFVAALECALKFKEEAGILPLHARCACDFNSISKRAEVQRRSRNPAIARALRV